MYNNDKFNFSNKPSLKNKDTTISVIKKPVISIISAYYNVSKYIEETAICVFNQTFADWEWIIVNDGSTEENAKDFLEKLAKKDSRIKIFHKENEGLPLTRDYAIKKSKAEYVYILDPDDLVDETFLECGYFSLMTNPEASWVYSNHVAFEGQEYTFGAKFSTEREKSENVICGSSIIRKKDLLEVGGYSKANKGVYEDWHLWLRMLAKGNYPIRMNYYGFWYRRREGVLHSINKNKKTKKDALAVINSLSKKVDSRKTKDIQFPIETNLKELLLPKEFDTKYKLKQTNKKQNLLFILPWLTIGGADKFNLELISKIDKTKYDITVVTTEYSRYVLRQEFEKYATVFDLTTFLKQKDWAGFIHHLIYSRNIQLVFLSNSYYGYYVLPWLKSKFPNVKFVDYLHAEDFSWRHGGYPRDSIAISSQLDMTYTCTKYLTEIMKTKMDSKTENIKTIYIGVDHKKFDRFNSEIEDLDISEYNNKKILLFACRIVELKRPMLALKIIEKISKYRDDVVLFVVGDGDRLHEMKEKAEKMSLSNKVKFFGMKDDIRPFYRAADVTLITSLTEGLTLTAYESLSMGVPVISSDVGGQKELINTTCGAIIKKYQSVEIDLFNRNYHEDEISEFVENINRILKDDKDTNRKRCRKIIEENFTIEKMVSNMTNEISKLISSKSKICGIDEKLAEKYLEMYIKENPLYLGNNTEINGWTLKDRLKDFLWQIPAWRFFIKVSKKIGINKIRKIKIFK